MMKMQATWCVRALFTFAALILKQLETTLLLQNSRSQDKWNHGCCWLHSWDEALLVSMNLKSFSLTKNVTEFWRFESATNYITCFAIWGAYTWENRMNKLLYMYIYTSKCYDENASDMACKSSFHLCYFDITTKLETTMFLQNPRSQDK